MTPHADLSDPIPTAPDDPVPTGGAPPGGGLPDFLTVVEAARLLRIGRTSAYLLAQQWLYGDGREGLPVVRVGRQLRVPRRALERLAGGELMLVPVQPSESPGMRESSARHERRSTTTRGRASPLTRAPTHRPRSHEPATATLAARRPRSSRRTDDDGTRVPAPIPAEG